MAAFTKIGTTWKTVSDYFINVSGTFKSVIDGWVNINGSWKRFFTSAIKSQYQVEISQATNATTKLITLTGTNYYWSPGPPALTYKFQRSSDNASWTDMSSGTATNPAFGSSNTYTDVINLDEYVKNSINYYRFQVNATYGLSTGSSTSLVTSFQAPTNITVTVGTITSNSEIPISWTTSTGANRYLVYYSTDDITYTLWAGTAATSATVNGLSPGTLYYIKVLPVTGTTDANIGYSGNFSNRVDGTTLSNTLSDFTIISVTKGFPTGAYGTRTVSASWNSSTNAIRYEVLLQKSDDGGATWSAASQFLTSTTSRAIAYSQSAFHTNSTTTTTTITGVLYSAYYRFSVRAVNSTGTTLNASNAPFEAVGTAPGAPTNITVTPGTTSISVSYTATTSPGSNNLTGIRYSTDNVTYSPGVESANPFTVSGFTPSTDNTIYIKSANADNLYSTAASKAFTTTAGVPGPPTNLTRSPGNGESKTFSWGAPTTGGAVTKYQYNLDNGGWTDVTPVNTNTSQSLTGISYSTTHTFQVRAVNGSGNSTAVSTGTFTVPRITTAPTASSITSTSATIGWVSNNQETYSLSIPGAPATPYTGSTATSRSITSLTAGTSYTPTLTVTATYGDTATSTGGAFTPSTTYYCSRKWYTTAIPSDQFTSTTDQTTEVCGSYKIVCSTSTYPAYQGPAACTCTATCGAWSAYTAYGAWSDWSVCTNNTQTRTRSRTRTRTCTAADCSTYTETQTDTQTESQACGGPTVCSTTNIYGDNPGETCNITCINGTTRTYQWSASCVCTLVSTVFNDCGEVPV